MFETTSIPAISNGNPLARPCQKSPGDHAVPPASKAFPPGCWTNSCPVAVAEAVAGRIEKWF